MRNRSDFHSILGKCVVGMGRFLPQRKQLLNKIEENVTIIVAELAVGGNLRLNVAKPG